METTTDTKIYNGEALRKELNRGKLVYVKARPKTDRNKFGHWSDDIKTAAVLRHLSGVTSREVSIELNVPYATILLWKSQPWFKEMVREIHDDDGLKLDNKLTKILHNTLDTVKDRLDKGDWVRDDKTGKTHRVPVKMRDANTAFTTLMDKRQLLRKQPTKITSDVTVNQQLQQLANEFRKFVGKVPIKEKQFEHIIEGEHVIIDEDGTGEWKE